MNMPDLDLIFKQYGDWWCKQKGGKCDRMNLVQKGYENRRTTISDVRTEYYGEPDNEIIPQFGAQQILTNRTSVEQSQIVTLTKTTTSTFSWNLQEGFKIGMKAGGKAAVPLVAEGSVEVSGEINFSSTQTWTTTEQKSWQVNQPIKVPPNREVEGTLMIDEQKFGQRYHASCILGGFVCSNSPSRVNGHYFWFHSVSSIFNKFPQRGFQVQGNRVIFQTDGQMTGLNGVRTRLDVTERPIGDKTTILRTYSIIEPIEGAGIAGLHDTNE